MRKSLLIILSVVLTASFADAQRTLLNFEDKPQAFGACFGSGSFDNGSCFDVIANPDQTGINMSDSVAQYIEPAEGEPWMGMFFDVTDTSPVDLTTAGGNTQLCADVWTATAGSVFTFKVEDIDSTGTLVSDYEGAQVTINNTNQWETVCDDMATFNSNANRLVFFFNIASTPGTQLTHYFDNVTQPGATSTSNLLNDKAVTIYPNPATHNLFFDTDGQPLTIIVSDMMGREMLRHHEFTNNNIRVSDFNTGTYIVTFIDEATGQVANSKFIKR